VQMKLVWSRHIAQPMSIQRFIRTFIDFLSFLRLIMNPLIVDYYKKIPYVQDVPKQQRAYDMPWSCLKMATLPP